MERYIGLDPHGTSCTFGVIGPSGRKLRNDVVETNGKALVSYLRGIPGRKHLCLEEGTQSAWLYEILSPHVEEIVVAGIGENRGQKSDVLDAFRRAEELRTGTIKKQVFKAPRMYSRLRELGRVHSMLVRDVVRVQGRVKAMYRARGVGTPGKSVYGPKERERWLRQLPVSSRWATEKLHEQYDLLLQLRKRGIDKVILAGMSANLCTEAHLRELLERGFEVAVVSDGTAAAIIPEGDGYAAAMVNFRFMANDVIDTEEAVAGMKFSSDRVAALGEKQ
mgnify:CR=1 FL=1